MTDSTVALAVVALFGTVFTALFKLLNDNTKALNKMTIASEKIAVETAKGNREAKQRNGHLGQQNVQIAVMLNAQTAQLTNIGDTLTSSAVLLAKDTKVALEGTETVRKTLKENRATGPFVIQGNLT